MRYVVGFGLLLLALGALRNVGCGEEGEGPKRCETDEECDDQNECTEDECRRNPQNLGGPRICSNVAREFAACDFNGVEDLIGEDGLCIDSVCVQNPCDDDNECTDDLPFDDRCEHVGCTGCQPCDWNGNPGVCIDGVCTEYPCNDGVICDDGDLCTYDFCDYQDAMCEFNPRCPARQCNTVRCEPTDGSCIYTPTNEGQPCSGCGDRECRGGVCVCVGTCFCIP